MNLFNSSDKLFDIDKLFDGVSIATIVSPNGKTVAEYVKAMNDTLICSNKYVIVQCDDEKVKTVIEPDPFVNTVCPEELKSVIIKRSKERTFTVIDRKSGAKMSFPATILYI